MTAPQSAPADPRRRLAIIVGAGVALGLLLFLGGRVLAGGGGEELGTAAPSSPAAPALATPAPVTPEGEAAPVETFEVFTTKNPFAALRTAAVAAPAAPAVVAPAAAPAPAPAAAVPAVAAPAAPTATPVSTSTAATTPTGGGQAAEPTRSATRVALLDVFAEGDRTVANVKVNDTVSKVGAGDTFSSNFKVVSLDPAERCGRFLYGDDHFRLCKGEEVLK